MNRTIKEATVKRFHYGGHDQPLGALMYGAGLGVHGEGIFKLAEAKIRQASNVVGAGAEGEAGRYRHPATRRVRDGMPDPSWAEMDCKRFQPDPATCQYHDKKCPTDPKRSWGENLGRRLVTDVNHCLTNVKDSRSTPSD